MQASRRVSVSNVRGKPLSHRDDDNKNLTKNMRTSHDYL